MARRQHIFNVIRRTFESFGFAPLETPTLENLSVLTGKYGDEDRPFPHGEATTAVR